MAKQEEEFWRCLYKVPLVVPYNYMHAIFIRPKRKGLCVEVCDFEHTPGGQVVRGTFHFRLTSNIGSWSISWKPPRPLVIVPASGVRAMTGEWAQ